jgi:hypothetical protein
MKIRASGVGVGLSSVVRGCALQDVCVPDPGPLTSLPVVEQNAVWVEPTAFYVRKCIQVSFFFFLGQLP